jgi:hypothetical protein
MIRKMFVVLFLAAVAILLWRGTPWFGRSGDLRATVVFDEATALSRGDAVMHDGEKIGTVESVSPMGEQQAVAIRVEKEGRNALRSDSLLRVELDGDARQLEVDSNFSVGRPVEDRAVIHAQDSKMARMIERGGAALAPVARQAKEKAAALLPSDTKAFEAQLKTWGEALPEWKAEGSESISRHFEDVKAKAAEAEASLRKAGKNLEADELRARAGQWIESAKKRIASDQ